MPEKRIKDPIYGYISIDNQYVADIIDTATFQRLRRIIQTGYSPVYPSAVHNRFDHSLGVYYLGCIAWESVQKDIPSKIISKKELAAYSRVFKLACLLHDVGHSPFSHTGENFYLDVHESGNGTAKEYDYENVHLRLIELVNSESFTKKSIMDEVQSNYANAHEILSAIVGISNFGEIIGGAGEKEFFARCITGYHYPLCTKDEQKKNSILNCLISLLNSKVIDVDKLDYLIRDAYLSGFESVKIDYRRLLDALSFIEKDGRYTVAYQKSAVSVLENVVYARDAVKKWIQSHPIILYESFLLTSIISAVGKDMMPEGKLFCEEALGQKGILLKNGCTVRYMCDDDIIFLMKNLPENRFVREYMDRRLRRHPIWKSEGEYNAVFSNEGPLGADCAEKLKKAITNLNKYLEVNSTTRTLNDDILSKIKKELDYTGELLKNPPMAESPDLYKRLTEDHKNLTYMYLLLKVLLNYIKQHNLGEDLIMIRSNSFNTGFDSKGFSGLLIFFSSNKTLYSFENIVPTLQSKNRDKTPEYFYLYYEATGTDERINKPELYRIIRQEFEKVKNIDNV